MQACSFVAELIAHCNDNTLAFGNMKSRDWPLAIDAHHRPVQSAIRVAINPCNVVLEVRCFRADYALKKA